MQYAPKFLKAVGGVWKSGMGCWDGRGGNWAESWGAWVEVGAVATVMGYVCWVWLGMEDKGARKDKERVEEMTVKDGKEKIEGV
jgi:hypothetical protein